MAELSEGTIVDGRYKVSSRLGSGGMADVYLAEDQQLGRKVALKVLHRRFAEDPGFVERFRREAQAAAGLQHPNVVAVYDRGSYEGTYYIVMEFLPGRSLKQLIRLEAPLDPVRAIDITSEVLKAARFAHRRGVIHRDLKPHNVIVDESGHATVTDFGIARAGASDMTETGSIMGTAQYLSPEQAQGHAVSPGSDLYAIGVVLYEMLTARVPFDGESPVTIALKHVSEAPPPPSAVNSNVPPELEQVVLWALNKDPADRPAEAEQFAVALEQARVAIVSHSGGQRTTSMAALVAVGEPVGAVLSTAVDPIPPPDGASTAVPEAPEDGAGPPDETQPPTPPEHRKRRWWPWALLVLALLLLAGGLAAAYLLTRPATTIVPRLVGEQISVAQTQVENAGLTPNIQYRMASQPSGIVINQDPLVGAKVKEGSTVTLTVSQGPGNVVVPPVDEATQQAAEQMLTQAGLKLGRVLQESSNTIPVGDATRTEPPAGTSLPQGSSVNLYVSTGQALISVQDVTGQSEGSAKATLQSQGFAVQVTTQQSSAVAAGDVISQSPSGGSQAAAGSTVTIAVATSPPTSTSTTTTSAPTTTTPTTSTAAVPNVAGDTAATARGALQAAGFQVSQQTTDTTKRDQGGTVISQSPSSGSTQGKGSTVTIVVAHYKPRTHTTTSKTSTNATTPGPTTTNSTT